jgi:hypothetical protein
MPIQDSDLLLIEDTSGVSKKIAASKLKANLAANTYNNYKLLVNKSDYSSRYVLAQNMQASVALTDYMLVERAGVSYKVTGQQIIDYFPSVPAGAAGPITDVVDTTSPTYNDTVVNPHPLGATTNSVLFNGVFVAKYNSTNVGSTDQANITTVVPFTPPLNNAATVVGFSGASPTSMTIYHENGDTQLIYSGFNGLNLVDFTINSSSPITQIELEGSNTDSTWIAGFKDSNGQALLEGILESELTLAGTTNLDLFTVGDAITMVDSDGDVASYTPVTSTIAGVSGNTLSFASPNLDLKFFNPGDVVQGDAIPSQIYSANPGTDWIGYGGSATYGAAQAFSGSTQNSAQSQQPRATLAFTDFPVATVGLIVDSGALDDSTVYYEINGTQVNSGNTTSSSWTTGGKILYEYNTDVALTSIVQVSSNSSSSKALYGITIDGNILIDGQGVDLGAVRVVSTDTAANTMAVDGGIWEGSDGTAAGTWNQSQVWSNTTTNNNRTDYPVTNAFDGDLNVFCASNSGGVIDFTPSTPLSGTLEILANNTGVATGVNTLRVFSDEGNISGAFYCKPHPEWTDCGQQTNITQITNTSTDGNSGSTVYAIKLNGSLLVDTGVSGTPVAETQVTAPAKLGTGNFSDNTGVVVDVSNSNQQWISNDNRLGEEFFIKAASTRTGLAILRTQAIQSAQIWQAALAPYPLRSIVIYEGNYYVNSGFAPPDVDRWLDLGPI